MPPRLSFLTSNLDWRRIRELAVRELLLAVRGREWRWLCGGWTGLFLLATLAVAWHCSRHGAGWRHGGWEPWIVGWALGSTIAFWWGLSTWSERRLRWEAGAGLLNDLWLSGCDVRELALARTCSTAACGVLLAGCWLPGALLLCAACGQSPVSALRFCLSLALSGTSGACFAQSSLMVPGRRSLSIFSTAWGWLAISTGIDRLFMGKIPWLSAARNFVISYNPIAAAVYAMGVHPREWPLAMACSLGWLLLWIWHSLRSFAEHWSPEWTPEPRPRGSYFVRLCTLREWHADDPAANQAAHAKQTEGLLDWWERRTGPRLRLGVAVWMPIALIAVPFIGLALVLPRAWVGWPLFQLSIWCACVAAAVNAGAATAVERERGRWEDLRLTCLTLEEWLLAKLRSAWLHVRLPLVAAAISILLTALVPRGHGASWIAWEVAAGVVAPPAFCVFGALVGLRSRSVEEAQRAVLCVLVGAPLLLAFLGLALPSGPLGSLALHLFVPIAEGKREVDALSWLSLAWYAIVLAGGWVLLRTRGWSWTLSPA